ncbi:NfeD family protein [Methylobacter sp. YRD-M1]|uniref:NfeD family protein n=1 Tax=Methylobacter sp. YRD-M1 TaxID=2911520 RepID=UPI00227B0AAB|nr:nodulation protein NfeD [Methylobacter sp. YRD-M1]WAK03542.1 nodulation protein NfeD [Methylobacter sp. YRD-M1]
MIMMRQAFLVFLVILAFTVQAETDDVRRQNKAATVIQLEINGAIGPATSDYISRNLDKAAEESAVCVIFRMDTPGGLDTSMRDIIKKIIASPVPVVTYVAPGGARAASAGTYILYASHIAAMAPGTNLGAATPVQMPGMGDSGDEKEDKEAKGAKKEKGISDPMAAKAVNDAVAYIRGLAQMRGRNADWAEQAVRTAASIPAEEALTKRVIDLVAADQADLLKQLHGRKINVLGQERILLTDGAVIKKIGLDWRGELLSVITNPNIAYLLMLIGIYGLIFEFANPGSVVPGTIGGICLLLALFAFQLLPINYAGMALILLGIALMAAEAFIPGIGVLGFGGLLAFIVGSVILIDTDQPGFGINPAIIGAVALSSAAFFILALGLLFKSRQVPIVSGREELIGATGVALEDFTDLGMIRIHSEIWRARSDSPISKKQKVTVTGLDGLILLVGPIKEESE